MERALDLPFDDETVGQACIAVRASVMGGENLPVQVIQAHRFSSRHDGKSAIGGHVVKFSDLDPFTHAQSFMSSRN